MNGRIVEEKELILAFTDVQVSFDTVDRRSILEWVMELEVPNK